MSYHITEELLKTQETLSTYLKLDFGQPTDKTIQKL